MSLVLQCDACGRTARKDGPMPDGWSTHADHLKVGGRSRYLGMRHNCGCLAGVEPTREAVDDDLPVLTEEQALLEVEEAARMAALDADVGGTTGKLIHRALAVLDAARERLQKGDP